MFTDPVVEYFALIRTAEYQNTRVRIIPRMPAEECNMETLAAQIAKYNMRPGDKLIGIEVSSTSFKID